MLIGTLFPEFKDSSPIFDDKSFALLVVWCFISEFSEKLVHDLISKTEENMAK
jgi:hypothetical protein